MAKIIVKFNGRVRGEVTLGKPVTTIGRTPTCDILIDNLAVSRHHADVIRQPDGHFCIQDRGSSNGTYINDRRIDQALLRDGDTVQVGKHTLLFVERADDRSQVGRVAAPGRDPDASMRRTMEWQLPEGPPRKADTDPETTLSLPPGPPRTPGRLEVVLGVLNRQVYPLANDATIIGKGDHAEVRLQGRLAPNLAAVIHRQPDGGYAIAPTQPGITLNDKRILQKQALQDGDLIGIQDLVFRFHA